MAGSFDDLLLLFVQEREPIMLEVMTEAVVTRSFEGRGQNPELFRPLFSRLAAETDPALRASMTRALGRIPASEMLKTTGITSYEQMIQDSAPEVREAVVTSLLAETRRSFGHLQTTAENAVAVATAAQFVDPESGARILEAVDINTADAASVDQVLTLLRADNARLRAGAATALGSVGISHAQRVTEVLVTRYPTEPEGDVRKHILKAIVRIGFANAAPTLQSLRGIDKTLDGEIDSWLAALQLNRQEWATLLREKERLARTKGA